MTICTNCREPEVVLYPVLVGSFTEHWCQFCVEMSATPCKTCGQRVDKDTAYRSGIGESVAYYCVSHRFAPLVKSRPSIELFAETSDELLGWLDKYIPSEACCEPDFRDGRYVHQEGCHGSIEANEEAMEA